MVRPHFVKGMLGHHVSIVYPAKMPQCVVRVGDLSKVRSKAVFTSKGQKVKKHMAKRKQDLMLSHAIRFPKM